MTDEERKAKRRAYLKIWHARNPDYQKKWYAKNRDHALAYAAKWATDHPERAKRNARASYLRVRDTPEHRRKNALKAREWNKRHPEKRVALNTRWVQAHPEKAAEFRARRRARKKAIKCERIDYRAIRRASDGRCGICRQPFMVYDQMHYDHIIPLASGGTHTTDNIQLAHASCNVRKGAKVA